MTYTSSISSCSVRNQLRLYAQELHTLNHQFDVMKSECMSIENYKISKDKERKIGYQCERFYRKYEKIMQLCADAEIDCNKYWPEKIEKRLRHIREIIDELSAIKNSILDKRDEVRRLDIENAVVKYQDFRNSSTSSRIVQVPPQQDQKQPVHQQELDWQRLQRISERWQRICMRNREVSNKSKRH